MQLIIPDGWMWFSILFALVLITSFIMSLLSRYFYTHDVVIRKFSIMDLELAPNAQEIVNIMKGIYSLPTGAEKVARSLRAQLYVDFIFMPAAYGSIFILCMQLSYKMPPIGAGFFSVLAWLQIIPWLCDIIENIYLLGKLRPNPVLTGKTAFEGYKYMEAAKWGIALFAMVSSLSTLLFFWLSGQYAYSSLQYVLIIVIEIVIIILAGKLFAKKEVLPADFTDN